MHGMVNCILEKINYTWGQKKSWNWRYHFRLNKAMRLLVRWWTTYASACRLDFLLYVGRVSNALRRLCRGDYERDCRKRWWKDGMAFHNLFFHHFTCIGIRFFSLSFEGIWKSFGADGITIIVQRRRVVTRNSRTRFLLSASSAGYFVSGNCCTRLP